MCGFVVSLTNQRGDVSPGRVAIAAGGRGVLFLPTSAGSAVAGVRYHTAEDGVWHSGAKLASSAGEETIW